MKYFYKLRSQILKEGVLKTIPTAHVKKLDFPDDMDKLRKTAPPNAKNSLLEMNMVVVDGKYNFLMVV